MPVVLARRALTPSATLCVPCVLLKRAHTDGVVCAAYRVMVERSVSERGVPHPGGEILQRTRSIFVLPKGSAVSGTSPNAFLRYVTRGESEAGALGTAKKKASEIKLTLVRNRLVVLNGICVFMVSLSCVYMVLTLLPISSLRRRQ